MRYAKFGSTDMVVSEIALGTWGNGGAGWDNNSEDTRLDAIRSAVESGINFIDTAPAYNGGRDRVLCGKSYQFHGNPEGTVPCNQMRHRIH